MATTNEVIRPLFITGLRDVHAVEHQALALIDRQLDRLAHYPEIEARLRSHRAETEEQITRVEQILADLGESHSGLKDLGLSISGNLAALSHTVAGDEIIKNSFANFAFENFEIASYTGLITLAQDGGFGSVTSLLEQSLAEEQSMAQFVIGGIPHVMRTFVDLRVAGEDASH